MIHINITRTQDDHQNIAVPRAAKPLKILIVDDSLILRRNMAGMLLSMGHTVAGEAKNGNEAILQYMQLKPDLVTMDITMPDMDGIAAVKEIRAKDPKANIIMVTSHGQEEMVISAIKAGAKGYLLKPLDAQKLSISIAKAFNDDVKKIVPSSISHFDDIDDIVIPEF